MGGMGNVRTNSEVVERKGLHYVAHPNTWRFGNPRTSLSREYEGEGKFGMCTPHNASVLSQFNPALITVAKSVSASTFAPSCNSARKKAALTRVPCTTVCGCWYIFWGARDEGEQAREP